jgi:signal transduction histidine kinase
VLVSDITDEKRNQDALKAAVRVRDDFLTIAGHELKTPLTALVLEVANLQRKVATHHPMEHDALMRRIDKIGALAERLDSLTVQLLDVSRLQAGKLTPQIERLDLVPLVRDAVERFDSQFERTGCKLTFTACASVVGRWDRTRLDQVVTNLVENAIKYGAHKPIEVEVSHEEHLARLVVRDHGIGIAPKDGDRIFGRFERAATERHYGGFGLGLWITRQLVEAQGGTIRFESSPGIETAFIVELPTQAS